MNKFEDYNASQIVPQRTLLEKFNKLIEYLKQNPTINLYYVGVNYSGTTYNISDVKLNEHELQLGDLVVFKNTYYSVVKTIGDTTFTVENGTNFRDVIDGDAFKPFNNVTVGGDLNDYTTIGSYWIVGSSSNPELNKPSDFTNGMLLVFTSKKVYDGVVNTVFQILINEKGIKYIRRKYGSTWTNWSKIDDYFKGKTYVQTDFNNYTEQGSYWVQHTNITNGLTTDENGMLLVFEGMTSSNVKVLFQYFFNNANIYVRRKFGDTWNTWEKTAKFGKGNSVTTDFNNYVDEGSYWINSNIVVSNAPSTWQSSDNGCLLVFTEKNSVDNINVVFQFIVGTVGIQYARRKYGSTWGDWNDVYHANEQFHRSVISGKKWYACGDSFTIQGYSSSDPGYGTDSVLPSGKYAGQNAVYPFYIGNRTDCDVHNVAVGGMSISYQSGHTNSFTYNENYKSIIPLDADIVTLYFGINDTNYGASLGTIDDNDITTFYGAWNTVMSWLCENRPNTKVGIIISNGMGNVDGTPSTYDAFVEAEINIAKKWGVAYLNIDGDTTLPLVIRTATRPNLSSTRRTQFLQQFAVNYPTNTHPNYKAHENESYMIQQFLERL